ncbi:hypothetical protein OS493_028169 [Desmophyllum pertusum]|uniref:Uncharacterized protein n=1 Tax=Desmophyllum pertusum TaxID=174260 RepID=A0A9X0CY10_9CNID|nr:hypothetical protein OS493_028169 [Desmophyllum pertusum]
MALAARMKVGHQMCPCISFHLQSQREINIDEICAEFIGKARQFTLQLSQCAINSTIKWNYTIRFLQGDSDVTERFCTYQRFSVCSWRSRIKRNSQESEDN